jgi:hypothetical protein
MPLAVGYVAQQINASDFPYASLPIVSLASPLNGAVITGLGGSMSYTDV